MDIETFNQLAREFWAEDKKTVIGTLEGLYYDLRYERDPAKAIEMRDFVFQTIFPLPEDRERIKNHCLYVLTEKGKEYAFEGDRLWNFHQASYMFGCPARDTAWFFGLKHIISLMDIQAGRLSRSFLNEKVGDLLNYVTFIYAMDRVDLVGRKENL